MPGFIHDDCSAIFPLTLASPFFRTLPLQDFGLEWIYPEYQLVHPFDDGTAIVVERSLEATANNLGSDGNAYRRLMTPLLKNWDRFVEDLLGPIPLPPRANSLRKKSSPHSGFCQFTDAGMLEKSTRCSGAISFDPLS
jgi:phytoene dehydrogenase-like protein